MDDITAINNTPHLRGNLCIFTGKTVETNKLGEHVIPQWLVKEYELQGSNVQLGSKEAIVKISKFTAPALQYANEKFGTLEKRIKEDQNSVSEEELHLWLMKIASGLLWNHCRLAQNDQHPNAPVSIDERLGGILSKDFQSGFSAWENGNYVRNGSLLKLPSSVNRLFFAHAFGAHIDSAFSPTHDAISPYDLIVFGRPNYPLLIATFFDEERVLEEKSITALWKNSILPNETSSVPARAWTSNIFHEYIVKPRYEEITRETVPEELFTNIAYSLGVEFFYDDEGGKVSFRDR